MSFKFKLTKKRTKVNDPQSATLWHATPSTTNRLTTRAVCKVITRNTTTAPTEAESTFNLVCDGIVHELQQGSSVQLGELGWMRLSFGSEGVEEVTEFDAATMIKNIKIVFTPSRELMAEIRKGLEFENAGVVEDGFTFATTKAYLEYKETGKLPVAGGSEGGSTEPEEPGGQGGGEGTLG